MRRDHSVLLVRTMFYVKCITLSLYLVKKLNVRVVHLIDLGSLKMVMENLYGHGKRFIDCCQVNTVLSGRKLL